MHPAEVWNGTSFGARTARLALVPLSWLYALGWQTYLGWYRLGFKKPAEPHRPVICVGNLLAGGGGKSPLVIHLVALLREMGHEVAVSASGYGSPRSEAATLAPAGALDPFEWGDEPSMLRWMIPDLPLIVGRRRVLAATICHREFPHAVMLMDDGFQHLPLRKHVSLLLDPAQPQNCFCLPAGPYREPRGNRRRADLVIPDRFHIEHQPLKFEHPDGTPAQVDEVDVICALGRPEAFLANLREMGLKLGSVEARPDHDKLSEGNLFERITQGRPIVVTAKDWVKLRSRTDIADHHFVIALQKICVEPKEEFRTWLQERLVG